MRHGARLLVPCSFGCVDGESPSWRELAFEPGCRPNASRSEPFNRHPATPTGYVRLRNRRDQKCFLIPTVIDADL
jgi:hypothetical protein